MRKQIDYNKPLNTKQMTRAQNFGIKIWKYKVVQCLEIQTGKVNTYSFWLHVFVLS